MIVQVARKVNIFNNSDRAKKTNKELAREKNLEEREAWHKILVKIITWKDGSVNKKSSEKISSKEWKMYKKKLIEAAPAKNLSRIQARIKETLEKIGKNGGFV